MTTIARKSVREALWIAGFRTLVVTVLFIVALVRKSPELGMVIYLFDFFEWMWLHYFDEFITATGGYDGAGALALFSLIVFVDTFAVVFLIRLTDLAVWQFFWKNKN